MSSLWAVVQKNWKVRGIGGLQAGRHFSRMKRIAVLIGISGDEHGGWIGRPVTNLVVWRVSVERSEVVRVVGCTELAFPDMRVVEEVIPQHVEHRNHTDHGMKEIWALRHCSSN